MQHALDIRLRLHIEDTEIRPGDTPRDTVERLLREIMTVDDKVLDVQVFSWTWVSRPLSGL
jgi:hypothetical protein